MATPVYTVLIADAATTLGSSDLGGPPSGFRWVIRDVDYVAPLAFYQHVDGVALIRSPGTTYFAGVWHPGLVGGQAYHVEGRWVVDYPTHVQLSSGLSGWKVTVSGYQLTLP